eukprot:5357365-Prymnesium_polylepis.1
MHLAPLGGLSSLELGEGERGLPRCERQQPPLARAAEGGGVSEALLDESVLVAQQAGGRTGVDVRLWGR